MSKRKIMKTLILFLYIVGTLLFSYIINYELPYTIITVGDTEVLSNNINIDGGYNSVGEFSFTTINYEPLSIPSYLSTLFKDRVIHEKKYKEFRYKRIYNQRVISMKQNSKVNILRLMGEDNYRTLYRESVSSVKDGVACDLIEGDLILTYDYKRFDNKDEYYKYIQSKELPASITYTVIKNSYIDDYYDERAYPITCDLIEVDGRIEVGYLPLPYVLFSETTELLDRINPYYSNLREPAVGMMATLEIYNQLIEEDLTSGYSISGAGTVELNGSIGQVDNIDYLIWAAHKNDIEYFLVADDDSEDSNYKNAKRYKEDQNLAIEIIKVNHIDEAIKFLRGLKKLSYSRS